MYLFLEWGSGGVGPSQPIDCSFVLLKDRSLALVWTISLAAGSKSFLEGIKDKLATLAKGRRILAKEGELHLREEMRTYNDVFDSEKEDTGPLNAYVGDIYS